MDQSEVKNFEQRTAITKLSQAIRIGATMCQEGKSWDCCALGTAAHAFGYRRGRIGDDGPSPSDGPRRILDINLPGWREADRKFAQNIPNFSSVSYLRDAPFMGLSAISGYHFNAHGTRLEIAEMLEAIGE
jgi:hypothetical protein